MNCVVISWSTYVILVVSQVFSRSLFTYTTHKFGLVLFNTYIKNILENEPKWGFNQSTADDV